MELEMESSMPPPKASAAPEYVNLIFALGASVGLAIGGCILYAVMYGLPGFRRRRRARTTWSIPEQAEEADEEQSLHVRVELLEQLTREWQAQLAEMGVQVSDKLSEICGVVQGELAKESASR